MKKGLLRLNNEELQLLEGKLGTIDVQGGCPVQCVTCAANAPKHSGSMSWSDYMTLSDSILDVKAKKGKDLILNNTIIPFWSSDPMYYHSFDGTVEKTIYDIVVDITTRHNKKAYLTTSGWKPGNNFMQRAAEKIAKKYDLSYNDNLFSIFDDNNLLLAYSVKTVSKFVIKEYDSFLEKSKNNYVANSEFIKNSKFVSNLINNMKTLEPIDSVLDIYDFQFIDNDVISLLDEKYSKYASLFSRTFMLELYRHLNREKILGSHFKSRHFAGMGRFLDIGKMSVELHLEQNIRIINREFPMPIYMYHAQIDYNGTLQIYLGGNDNISKLPVSKNYFTKLVKKNYFHEDKIKYELYANLCGRELLR